ncbi:MAG: hypothetical protein ACT4PU_11880 [Planctomycetota bacterium]
MRTRVLAAGLALLLSGCTVLTVRFGEPLPDEAALAALQPGVHDYAQVCALLGPPDDEARPVPLAALRAQDPVALRVLDERELLGRRVHTWAHDTRVERRFEFLPVLTLFSHSRVESSGDRLVAFFDGQGRLLSWSWQGEE